MGRTHDLLSFLSSLSPARSVQIVRRPMWPLDSIHKISLPAFLSFVPPPPTRNREVRSNGAKGRASGRRRKFVTLSFAARFGARISPSPPFSPTDLSLSPHPELHFMFQLASLWLERCHRDYHNGTERGRGRKIMAPKMCGPKSGGCKRERTDGQPLLYSAD